MGLKSMNDTTEGAPERIYADHFGWTTDPDIGEVEYIRADAAHARCAESVTEAVRAAEERCERVIRERVARELEARAKVAQQRLDEDAAYGWGRAAAFVREGRAET